MELKRKSASRQGSALIMTIVITVLLAVVGSLFVLMARVEKTATSARSDSEELKLAVNSVTDTIANVLAQDVPGMKDANNLLAEYYDYPGPKDKWLANIEPEPNDANAANPTKFCWRQVTNLFETWSGRDIAAEIIPEYQNPEDVSDSNNDNTFLADADGDGVSDAVWQAIPSLTTSKGKPVFAAVRIIDNCGMINVNTAYKFDANSTEERYIDGSTVAQIDLASLNIPGDEMETKGANIGLHNARCNNDANLSNSWDKWSRVTYISAIPGYGKYYMGGMPFDFSDELELRNRYLLDSPSQPRLEQVWDDTVGNNKSGGRIATPFDVNGTDASLKTVTNWYDRLLGIDPPVNDDSWDYRHLLTAVSKDRIIDADGQKAFSINGTYSSAHYLYNRIFSAMDTNLKKRPETQEYKDLDATYAQVAASLYDYRDADSEVTGIMDKANRWHFGYERPCIWISELVTRTYMPPKSATDANADPSRSYNSYAIEVYKQHETMEDFNDWRLVVDYNDPLKTDKSIPLDPNVFEKNGRFFVNIWQPNDPCDPNTENVRLDDEFNKGSLWQGLPADGAVGVDPNAKFGWGPLPGVDDANIPEWRFKFYFGEAPVDHALANPPDQTSIVSPAGSYDPNGWARFNPGPMKKNTTYCWRLVDIDPDPNGNPVGDPNHIYFFKTGDPDPNIIPTDVNDRIFDANTVIRLERPYNVSDFNDTTGVVTTDADWLIVDKVDVPKWLVDHNDPNSDPNYTVPNGVTRSYSRALHWGHILQRVWDVNGVTAGRYPSLGDWNNFNVSDPNYLWTWPRNYNFDNVGDVALMLKKPVYFLSGDDPCQAVGYTANNRREENVRIDLTDPNMQRIFNYIAVLDPAINISDPNYQNVTTVYGRLNINTAPARVLSKLPWVANRGKSTTGWTTTKNELAEAIVAYREKLKLNADVDYTSRSALKGGREEGTGIGPQLREEPGFASIAEIAMVTNPGNSSAARDYSMWWYALEQTGDQPGYPDLTNWYWRERGDGIADDFEERYLIFSRISDICTVRSDVFTAYILVRLGQDGPQRRMIAIFDRSEVGRDAMTGQWGGKVKLLALQPVPEVR